MTIRLLLPVMVVVLLAGCAGKPLPPVAKDMLPPMVSHRVDYLSEVQPLLVKRCVVCHSCYNSPCQLKLSAWEGLDRGATKKAVYYAERLHTMDPTRLFIDAQTTAGWRKKEFFSVTQNSGEAAQCGLNDSILLQLLAQKQKKEAALNTGDAFRPEEDELTCAKDGVELNGYLEKHPNRGMPYGFPPLDQDEFALIASWIMQGVHGPSDAQLQKLKAIAPEDAGQVAAWEDFFNKADARHVMTARYLYEHLFLAHIKFDSKSNVFYELVRSKTPPGKPIDIIATNLPYEAPGTDKVYYRFRKIHETIVHKTHMVFELSGKVMQRWNELFIDTKWLEPPHIVDYSQSANPFIAFMQIPPKSRYRFLLDNIQYIIMTFIRGPVCKGQAALNVIQDNFWLLFLDPEYDLTVQYPGFLAVNQSLLNMPIMENDSLQLLKDSFILKKFRHFSSRYVAKRRDFYATHQQFQPVGAEAIWAGDTPQDSPLLTVFRHFDSASVHRGPLGDLPPTIWVMDYPLIERIYYSLVAGFNVFGNAFHQGSIRVYMDELRQEGETYFLDFMPLDVRHAMMQSWYGNMDIDQESIDYTPSRLMPGFRFRSEDPKREFIEYLVRQRFLPSTGMAFDVNYRKEGEDYPPLPRQYKTETDYIQGFRAISRPGTAFVSNVRNHDANLAYVRIRPTADDKDDLYYSLVINRWHDDVTTMFGEEQRLRPEKDSAVCIKGFIGSYPNYFFDVAAKDLPEFFRLLESYDGGSAALTLLDRFGVNRGRKDFWRVYDSFQEKFLQSDPVQAGIFDLNRYFNKVFITN